MTGSEVNIVIMLDGGGLCAINGANQKVNTSTLQGVISQGV